VEEEFRDLLRQTELEYVRRLAREIEAGTLEGLDWWRAVHQADGHDSGWAVPALGPWTDDPGHREQSEGEGDGDEDHDPESQ
jgi:hypothetical protein